MLDVQHWEAVGARKGGGTRVELEQAVLTEDPVCSLFDWNR